MRLRGFKKISLYHEIKDYVREGIMRIQPNLLLLLSMLKYETTGEQTSVYIVLFCSDYPFNRL